MRNGIVGEQAQHVREGVHHAQAGHIAGIAEALLGHRRRIHVFHGGVRDLLRLEEFGQFLQARIRHLGDTHAHGRRSDAGLLMGAGQDGE